MFSEIKERVEHSLRDVIKDSLHWSVRLVRLGEQKQIGSGTSYLTHTLNSFHFNFKIFVYFQKGWNIQMNEKTSVKAVLNTN